VVGDQENWALPSHLLHTIETMTDKNTQLTTRSKAYPGEVALVIVAIAFEALRRCQYCGIIFTSEPCVGRR